MVLAVAVVRPHSGRSQRAYGIRLAASGPGAHGVAARRLHTARSGRCSPIAASAATGPTPANARPSCASTRATARSRRSTTAGRSSSRAIRTAASWSAGSTPTDDEDLMPPAESHLALTGAEKALLPRWVEEGADYRPHWSFAAGRSAPAPPRPADAASTEPDRRVHRARGSPSAGLRPAPPASRETLIRRAGARPDRPAADARPRSTRSSPTTRRRAYERVVDR